MAVGVTQQYRVNKKARRRTCGLFIQAEPKFDQNLWLYSTEKRTERGAV